MTERDGTHVEKWIREAILRLKLRPGQVLDEARLSEELMVSRTPVREAIIKLIADGLIIRDGRKAKVTPLDFDEVPKLFDALLISSRMVHRLAAEFRTDANLEEINRTLLDFEDSVASGGGVDRSEANLLFHQAIARAANNRYFAGFYDQALIGTIRMARACFANSGQSETPDDLAAHLAETKRQHRAIQTAIQDQNVEAADQMAVEHFHLTKLRLKTVLFRGAEVFEGLPNLSMPNDRWEFS